MKRTTTKITSKTNSKSDSNRKKTIVRMASIQRTKVRKKSLPLNKRIFVRTMETPLV